MISFYPGPSRVHDEIPDYVQDAYDEGVLSINHRSEAFMKISEKTIRLLKSRLDIPGDYSVFYTTSATECWELIAQSVMTDAGDLDLIIATLKEFDLDGALARRPEIVLVDAR